MTLENGTDGTGRNKDTPLPTSNYTAAASTTEQESTALLDNGTFNHRVRQPTANRIRDRGA